MPKKAAIVKPCPKCDQNVAVASKTCKCGYSFFNARRGTRGGTGGRGTVNKPNELRRTSRKPKYYDSQEFDKKKKKKDKRGRPKVLCTQPAATTTTQPSTSTASTTKIESKESTAARAKRRRLRKEQEDGGGDLCAKLTVDKQELATIILAEINRKMGSVMWSP